MPFFRKKPVVIEAVCYDGDVGPIVSFTGDDNHAIKLHRSLLHIWNTLEGCYIHCPLGHWVIKGVHGEFYPCDPAVFEETYEPAPDGVYAAEAKLRSIAHK